ncbi:hypothetical protein [Anderseniella sp. Alg231-50]|uniref:hypothetical protein n=1 Tax=Anderseniella sp. Alg231-50 TaxID=1922226 RepID=UPI00307BA912
MSVGEEEWQPEETGVSGSLAVVLAKEFPESFRWAQEVTASARKCIRLEYSAPHRVEAQVQQVFADLQELKKRLLHENFYFRVIELEIESTPEVLDLAKTSADWRIVLLFSFLDEELPQFEQEFDYAMNLLAANSKAIVEGTGKLRPSFEAVIAAMAA